MSNSQADAPGLAPAALPLTPEGLVKDAARRLGKDGPAGLADYDRFPAPLYAIDAAGRLIYFNAASSDFAGHVPTLGVDCWCILWRLHTPEGVTVPLHQSPMAIALRDRSSGCAEMVAERPDGKRTGIRGFPTAVIDAAGALVGAVNLLVPVDGELHRKLLATVQRCRTLARGIGDRQASEVLTRLAEETDRQARLLCPD